MKLLHAIVWVAVGAALGSFLGRTLFPEKKNVKAAIPLKSAGSGAATPAPTENGSLFASLPKLKDLNLDAAERLLRDRRNSLNPLRIQATIDRLLLQLAGDTSRVPELVELINSDKDFRRMIGPIFTRWAEANPVTAMQAIDSLVNHHLKWQAIRSVMKTWAASDPETALAYLENLEANRLRSEGMKTVIQALAEVDPQHAIDEARRLADARLEDIVYQSVVTDLATKNVERAFDWIGKLEDPQLRRRLRNSAISTVSKEDPEGAISLAAGLEDSEERSSALHVLLGNLAFSDRKVVQETLLDLPAGDLDDSAVFYIGQIMGLKSFDETFVYGQTLPDGLRPAFMAGVISDAASKKPADWADRVNQYVDEGKQRNFVFARIADAWLDKDRAAASEWLGELPPSEARDEAVSTFAKELFPIDPKAALNWADSIHNEKQRGDRVAKLLKQWRVSDPNAVEAWLANQE